MKDINFIANFVLSHRAIIFGGYVRDMIAGEQPHDIDALVSIINKKI